MVLGRQKRVGIFVAEEAGNISAVDEVMTYEAGIQACH
jgi:hypothetical protein